MSTRSRCDNELDSCTDPAEEEEEEEEDEDDDGDDDDDDDDDNGWDLAMWL